MVIALLVAFATAFIMPGVGEPVYQSDPEAAPDAAFVRGDLSFAVLGNRARLLDARRTPLSLTDVVAERGEIEVRVDAFEHKGVRWRLPLWEIARLQFTRDSTRAPADRLRCLERAVERFDRELIIPADPAVLSDTRRRLDEHRRAARGLLGDLAGTIDLQACVNRREGDKRLYRALTLFLAERGLVEVDRGFTEAFVTNPAAGEIVKGHAIVLAELGLLRFHGTVIRDPGLFAGEWSRAQRAEHLLARMAFCRELCAAIITKPLRVYRAAALEAQRPAWVRGAGSFVSCTFSEQVAAAHFAGGPSTHSAVMWRQLLDPERALMTFLETAAMNDRFKEAEAVLIADPTSPAF